MIVSKNSDRLPCNSDVKTNSVKVIDPVRYIFRVILMSADALFLIYLAWAARQLSDLDISYLRNVNILKSLSLIWTLKIFWGLCFDKLGFTFNGSFYRLRYALCLAKYYFQSLLNSIINSFKKGKFKLYFDPSELPIDTHNYKSRRKSQMVILSHLLSLIALQIITITHWVMPFELLNLNENLQYVKFFGVLLVGFSIAGQSVACDSRLYCDAKELPTEEQMVSVCELLSYKAFFGLLAHILLLCNKLYLFKYLIVSKCIIIIAILLSRGDINQALQSKYFSNNKVDNFEILVPCLWFFIIMHCGIDSRWYLQHFGIADFPWPKLFDILTTLSNQFAKIAITIFIGMYLKFSSFSTLFPLSIAFCLIMKLLALVVLKMNFNTSYILTLMLIESISSSFIQQAILTCILMISISAPTTIPIALMSLPSAAMHYSMMLRYYSSIWNSVLSAQSSIVTIQTISISIYLVALVTCWNIKFGDITNKVQEAHNLYLKKLNRQCASDIKSPTSVKGVIFDEEFWECDN